MKTLRNKTGRMSSCFLVMAACVMLSGCASNNEHAEVYDPLEGINRTTFAINDAVDQALVEPVARGYKAAVPEPARKGIGNFLSNLRSPVNAANQLLQGDIRGTARDVSRFAINTVVGIGGLIDVADRAGLKREDEDFGQTLAVWGVDHGPYLVLPILGPSSFRDATGLAVDSYFDPLRMYLHNTGHSEYQYARMAMSGLHKRTELLEALDDLRRNSIDYYAALRSAYYQKRAALVSDDEPGDYSAPSIPDYDDPSYDDEAYYGN